jgi:hypothetical protein
MGEGACIRGELDTFSGGSPDEQPKPSSVVVVHGVRRERNNSPTMHASPPRPREASRFEPDQLAGNGCQLGELAWPPNPVGSQLWVRGRLSEPVGEIVYRSLHAGPIAAPRIVIAIRSPAGA